MKSRCSITASGVTTSVFGSVFFLLILSISQVSHAQSVPSTPKEKYMTSQGLFDSGKDDEIAQDRSGDIDGSGVAISTSFFVSTSVTPRTCLSKTIARRVGPIYVAFELPISEAGRQIHYEAGKAYRDLGNTCHIIEWSDQSFVCDADTQEFILVRGGWPIPLDVPQDCVDGGGSIENGNQLHLVVSNNSPLTCSSLTIDVHNDPVHLRFELPDGKNAFTNHYFIGGSIGRKVGGQCKLIEWSNLAFTCDRDTYEWKHVNGLWRTPEEPIGCSSWIEGEARLSNVDQAALQTTDTTGLTPCRPAHHEHRSGPLSVVFHLPGDQSRGSILTYESGQAVRWFNDTCHNLLWTNHLYMCDVYSDKWVLKAGGFVSSPTAAQYCNGVNGGYILNGDQPFLEVEDMTQTGSPTAAPIQIVPPILTDSPSEEPTYAPNLIVRPIETDVTQAPIAVESVQTYVWPTPRPLTVIKPLETGPFPTFSTTAWNGISARESATDSPSSEPTALHSSETPSITPTTSRDPTTASTTNAPFVETTSSLTQQSPTVGPELTQPSQLPTSLPPIGLPLTSLGSPMPAPPETIVDVTLQPTLPPTQPVAATTAPISAQTTLPSIQQSPSLRPTAIQTSSTARPTSAQTSQLATGETVSPAPSSTPIATPPVTVAPTSSHYCGCISCTPSVWNADADTFTCGARIEYMVYMLGESFEDACRQVAGVEFPQRCGPFCDPDSCQSIIDISGIAIASVDGSLSPTTQPSSMQPNIAPTQQPAVTTPPPTHTATQQPSKNPSKSPSAAIAVANDAPDAPTRQPTGMPLRPLDTTSEQPTKDGQLVGMAVSNDEKPPQSSAVPAVNVKPSISAGLAPHTAIPTRVPSKEPSAAGETLTMSSGGYEPRPLSAATKSHTILALSCLSLWLFAFGL